MSVRFLQFVVSPCWRCWGRGYVYGNATTVEVVCPVCRGVERVGIRCVWDDRGRIEANR